MDHIEQEMEAMAEELSKSSQEEEFSVDLIKATVMQMGPEGLKKAAANLSDDQKALLAEVLEDMAKAAKTGEGSRGGKIIGHTKSGKPIYGEGNHGAKGWSADDHMDAYHAHTEEGMKHGDSKRKHPAFEAARFRQEKNQHGGHDMRTPEETVAVSPSEELREHSKNEDHHHGVADKHYQHAKKKGWSAKDKMTSSDHEKASNEHSKKRDASTPEGRQHDAQAAVHDEKAHQERQKERAGMSPKEKARADITREKEIEGMRAEAHKEHMATMKKAGEEGEGAVAMEKSQSNSLEPKSDSTPDGDAKENMAKPKQDDADEALMDEAKKKKQQEIRHQGGVDDGSGLEGQIIKAESMEDASKKIMAMEVKEHGTKDPKKLVEAEKQEHKEEGKEPMEKGEASAMPSDKVPEQMEDSAEKKDKLKGMMKRMQERKMEKSACVAVLAKSFDVAEEKLAQVWEIMEKSDASEATKPKDQPEAAQVEVPVQMKDGAPVKKKEPMSGHAADVADENGAPKPMMKSFYHEEEQVYSGNEDVFKSNRYGKNTHFSVDAYIEEQAVAQASSLKKSTFQYLDADTMAKSMDPAQMEVDQVVNQNAKKKAEAKKEAKTEIRDIKLQEKLSHIEGKMPMLKSDSVAAYLEKGVDMGEHDLETAQAVKNAPKTGAALVKSFSDEEMDAQFNQPSIWSDEKK